MNKFLFILLAISLWCPSWAQEYHLQFSQALEKGDTNALRATLNAWSKLQPTEADYYIDQFNFYVNRALSQTIILTQDNDEVDGEALTMTDTTGDIAGYLVMGVPTIESKMADSAILWINKGLEQHPYRLDMWMGRTHFLGITQRWDDFEHTLLDLIDRYSTTKSKLWKYPDVGQFNKEMFSESILQYQQTLVEEINLSAMERSDTLMLNRMANIAQRMLKYYPKDIYQLNIMAVYHNALGQPEECLRYLLKAEKQDRRDCTVLANIANTYHTLENYKQERKYLEKLLKYGDEDSQEYARHFLKELESQGH